MDVLVTLPTLSVCGEALKLLLVSY